MNNPSGNKQLKYRSYANQFKNWYKKPVAQTSSAVVLTLFTIVFFGIAAIRPTLITITKLLREIEDKQEYDQDLSTKLNNLTSVQKKYTDNQEVLNIFNNVLPHDQGVNQLFAQIEAISANNNVTLETISTNDITTFDRKTTTSSSKKSKLDIESYELSMSLSGSLADLNQWLFEIQNIERMVEVSQISIRPSDDEQGASGQLNDMSVTTIVYWIPEN